MIVEAQDPLVVAAETREAAIREARSRADRAFVKVVREELKRATVVEVAERLSMSRGGVHRLLRAYPEKTT